MDKNSQIFGLGELNIYVRGPEKAAEVMRFFPDLGCGVLRQRPKLGHIHAQTLSFLNVLPYSRNVAVYKYNGSDPALWTVNFRMVIFGHKMYPVFMTK